MTQLVLPRRKFLVGAAALIAAPAIVRAASLMPIKAEQGLELYFVPDSGWATFCTGWVFAEFDHNTGLWKAKEVECPITGLRP